MARPRVRALLIDLSGTLHIGHTALPGAAAALARLRAARVPLRFCSNASKESTRALREKLEGMDIGVREGELCTSLGAAAADVRGLRLRKPFFLLSDSAMEEFPEYERVLDEMHAQYDGVVIGLAPELLNYKHLTTAFRILMHGVTSSSSTSRASSSSPGEGGTSTAPPTTQPARPAFITTHRARYIRTPDGELSLGPGPFVAALEDAVGRGLRAEVIGKPTRAFFERVLGSLEGDLVSQGARGVGGAEEGATGRWRGVAVIGDDISADLGEGAVELGLWRVLVKTGKYQTGDETRPDVHPPDEVQPSFAAFVDSLLGTPEAQKSAD